MWKAKPLPAVHDVSPLAEMMTIPLIPVGVRAVQDDTVNGWPVNRSTMQTVILAAGQGTRMGPLTESTPKPMLPVAGRPLVAHVADAAVDAGASELVVVVGYEAEAVRSFFGDTYRDVPVTFAVQAEQAGTADAVRAARPELDGAFAVLNGDNLYDPAAVEQLFESAPSLATYEVDDPSNYGVVSITDGIVTDIVEKPADPPTTYANTGAYVFPEAAIDWLDVPESERGEYEITDVVAQVIDAHEVTPVPLSRWRDVGRPWELLEANETLLAELDGTVDGTVSDDAELRGTVVVEAGATIEPGVVIEGPVYVSRGASVGPNAYLRGGTFLGADVHVGNGVEIKNSVIRRGTNVPHLSYVGDSVLGQDVNFGAGTNVANLRHDGATVHLTVKGDRISTGRRKFGVVVGDGVKTGINTSLEPGVTLSGGTVTEPGERVRRDR
ncbi:Nucleotidyl transferase [Halorhabdus utahensis DSM 12940]|uniref:Bifunctional protein GlmU n=2 Tax=Halorhabdus utahensis TaxID=146826 RepID=C7NR86_HALUD|nr:Nucleotidyl transferase [Halorhabdus utahensis DSM 12940]